MIDQKSVPEPWQRLNLKSLIDCEVALTIELYIPDSNREWVSLFYSEFNFDFYTYKQLSFEQLIDWNGNEDINLPSLKFKPVLNKIVRAI